MSKTITPLLFLAMLIACSGEETPEQSTPEVMETALSKQDCLDLKAQHYREMQRHSIGSIDRVNDTEQKPIHMQPKQTTIRSGESLEDFNQRMQQDAEDRTKHQAEEIEQRQSKFTAQDNEYKTKITALKQEVDECFAQLQ